MIDNSSRSGGVKRNRISTGKNKAIALVFRLCLLFCIFTTVYQNYSMVTYWTDDDTKFFQLSLSRPEETMLQTKQQAAVAVAKISKHFVPCPDEFCKLVWFQGDSSHKLYEPVYRAFHSRGYSTTEDVDRAHFLWMDQPNNPRGFHETLHPWQRYNHLPNTDKWDDKDKMAQTMNNYYSKRGIPHLHSFPESYVLHSDDGLEAFRKRLLEENGGMEIPWVLKEPTVNQGKGIVILPQRSEELRSIIDIVQITKASNRKKDHLVVQRYICDEMTYNGRKFDVRVFWAVASVDPLIVLYNTEQNYVRIGHAQYDESSLGSSNTRSHLTTHTFGSTETKATWDEFRELIERHVFASESDHRYRFSRNRNNIHRSSSFDKTIDSILSDPLLHVQNQMKTVIGHLANAYRNITFHARSMTAENGFTWHAADMIIDNNLDVYIIEGTDGPGKDEDYDFRIRMHGELLGSLVDIIEEVVSEQKEGRPLDVAAMKEKGVLGGYEVVFNNGWFVDYRYQRLPTKECIGNRSSDNISTSNSQKKNESKLSFPEREIVPATFTALTNKHNDQINYSRTKTFWMKSRTTRTSEPVARSLRRNGWTPVDTLEEAQLIYSTEEKISENYRYLPRPWQWISQFPSQYSFFEGDHLNYLDFTKETGRVCRPIEHNNRPLEVIVYWLVLSLDPLIVLYHDGFLYFEYSRDDENEFLNLSKRDGRKKSVWKGSWTAFEYYLNITHTQVINSGKSEAAAAAAGISMDPILHVRNQMKSSVVNIAKGFSKHTAELDLVEKEQQKHYSSFAIFYAQFQIDRNLNVFALDAYHSYMKGEDHNEIVSLHDDIYGSSFQLIEYFNATKTLKRNGWDQQDGVMGKYELLIYPDGNSSKNKHWEFLYNWRYKAMECFE